MLKVTEMLGNDVLCEEADERLGPGQLYPCSVWRKGVQRQNCGT